MTECDYDFIYFKSSLLFCLHSLDKQSAMTKKLFFESVDRFSVAVNKRDFEIEIRALDPTTGTCLPQEEFYMLLRSDKFPFDRFDDHQTFTCTGRFQSVDYHVKDRYCERCLQTKSDFDREYSSHDIVCKITKHGLDLSSQQDPDFFVVFDDNVAEKKLKTQQHHHK